MIVQCVPLPQARRLEEALANRPRRDRACPASVECGVAIIFALYIN
jgi:hypothetical protein